MKRYTKTEIMNAVQNSNGCVSTVAVQLGCAWATARTYIDKFPAAVEALEVQQSRLVAEAVNQLHKAIDAGERWAIERVLDTIGRRAGFGLVAHSRIDQTTNGEPVNRLLVEYIEPKVARGN